VSSGYRADIDGLRGLAVLLVVIFHAFPDLLPGGFVGVDIFFVISGFLISSIILTSLDHGTFTISGFYARRVRRILPALVVVLLASLIFGWFYLVTEDYSALGKHVAAGAGFVSNIILWMESGYFDVKSELKPLLHLWSLGVEEQFYLIWPFLLLVLWKYPRIAVPTLVIIAVSSFAYNVSHVKLQGPSAFYLPWSRFWQLTLGALLAYGSVGFKGIPEKLQSSRVIATLSSVLGITLIVLALLFISKQVAFPGWWALLPTLGTVLIIWPQDRSLINSTILSNRLLVGIGLISYPLYLIHWPALSLALIVNDGAPLPPELRLVLVFGSILAAWTVYKAIEVPIRSSPPRTSIVATLLILLGVLGALGGYVVKRQGMPERFPEIIRHVTSHIDFDIGKHMRGEKCHLGQPHLYEIDPSCYETARPLIAIWGDSHGAVLYGGLAKLQATHKFGIIQATAVDCPPLLNGFKPTSSGPFCNEINQRHFQAIAEREPDTLLLAAGWLAAHCPRGEEFISLVKSSLTTIKARMPKTRIIVLGPLPDWGRSPAASIYQYWLNSKDLTKEPPVRISARTYPEREAELKQAVEAQQVEYISLAKYLCEGDLCISRVGPLPTDLIAFDYAHLSSAGSDYLMEKLQDALLTPPRK
jgi:peptidoglycan/LPS O-acetylase OafA/YrhL